MITTALSRRRKERTEEAMPRSTRLSRKNMRLRAYTCPQAERTNDHESERLFAAKAGCGADGKVFGSMGDGIFLR